MNGGEINLPHGLGQPATGHVMGIGAGFHDDRAGVECGEEFGQLLAAELLAQQGLPWRS